MDKLISVDIHARFGFLKKPDINVGTYLTYNMLHKPALLGILGAIAGLKGYSIEGEMKPEDIPEYRAKLSELEIAITPLASDNGNFEKTVIKYTNTVGYASAEQGGVLIVDEQTLINPSYRIYLLLNNESELHQLLYNRLEKHKTEYVPYLGKNDHQLWWKNFQEWTVLKKDYKPKQNFKIKSIFIKPLGDKLPREKRPISLEEDVKFIYFERLPKGWQQDIPHYELDEFLFTNYPIKPKAKIPNLISIKNSGDEQDIIQLF